LVAELGLLLGMHADTTYALSTHSQIDPVGIASGEMRCQMGELGRWWKGVRK